MALEIDTGADRSILTENEAKRLGLKFRKFKNPKSIVGVEGNRIICEFYVILNLILVDELGSKLVLNVMFYVFNSKMPNLLGSDVLNYLEAAIDYQKRKLIIGNKTFLLSSKPPKSESESEFGLMSKEVKFRPLADISLPSRGCQKNKCKN